jgi:competence protein ComEC
MNAKSYVVILALLSFLVGIRIFYFFQQVEIPENGQELVIQARLAEEPQILNGRMQFSLQTEKIRRVRIITGLENKITYGDILEVSGEVRTSEKNGYTFFTMSFPNIQINNNDQNIVTRTASRIRIEAAELFSKSLSPVSANLLTGILFGGNQDMPKSFLNDLRNTGVIHVIAASGMNVTFVAGALMGVLGLYLKRQVAITIAIFGVVFYAFLAGFEPSIVRAAIMSVIAFSANLLGRQSFAIGSVFLTAFLMLFISPQLMLDIGFQLSFLATLGILLLKPLLPFGNKFILDDIGTTIGAQVATFPILLGTFGQYGMLSILVNALVLFTVPILMIIGSVGLIVGLVIEPLGRMVLFLASPVLLYFEFVVAYFGKLSWTLNVPPISPMVWIGYYLLLLAFIFYSRSRKTATEKDALS